MNSRFRNVNRKVKVISCVSTDILVETFEIKPGPFPARNLDGLLIMGRVYDKDSQRESPQCQLQDNQRAQGLL